MHGGWNAWGPWSPCGKTCGRAVRERVRLCTNPPPFHGGRGCGTHYRESEECALNKCPGEKLQVVWLGDIAWWLSKKSCILSSHVQLIHNNWRPGERLKLSSKSWKKFSWNLNATGCKDLKITLITASEAEGLLMDDIFSLEAKTVWVRPRPQLRICVMGLFPPQPFALWLIFLSIPRHRLVTVLFLEGKPLYSISTSD